MHDVGEGEEEFSNVVELQIENFQLSYPSILYGGN
jgi:hypothetical protein